MIKSTLNNEKLQIPKLIRKFQLAHNSYFDLLEIFHSKQNYLLFLIEKADLFQIKILSPFIMNYFYTNILEIDSLENEILSLIWALLNKEIPILNNLNDSIKLEKEFLNENSKLFYFLSELTLRNDIKDYFSNILIDVIKEMEKYSDFLFLFDIESLKEDIKIEKIENLSEEDIQQRKEERNIFYGKYIIALRQKELNKNMDEFQNNEIMKNYCLKQLNCYEGNDDDIFSTQNFINELFAENDSEKLLDQYELSFMLIKKIINLIFDNFIKYIDIIPYSIKCVCKLIEICYKEKNPNFNSKLEVNALINKFFFDILFDKIFLNPELEGNIYSMKISKNVKNNIKKVMIIIKQMASLQFFSNKNNNMEYTPFNWYFLLNIMPTFFKFTENLVNVKLPTYIEKIIKNKEYIPYNFLEENPNELFYCPVICVNVEQLIVLSEIFFETLKSKEFERKFSKNESDEFVPNLKQQIRIKDMRKNPLSNFTIHFRIFSIKKLESLINLTKSKFFTKEEIKHPTEEQIVENNVIKIQNFLSNLLYNYKALNINDFSKDSINGTINILKELIKFFKKGSFISDESIPSEWYANSLITMLTQLPEEYKKNDFDKVFKNLEEGISKSRESFDFKPFGILYNKLKFIHREVKKIIELNKDLNEIIKNK